MFIVIIKNNLFYKEKSEVCKVVSEEFRLLR